MRSLPLSNIMIAAGTLVLTLLGCVDPFSAQVLTAESFRISLLNVPGDSVIATAALNPSAIATPIAPDFMGISHEWGDGQGIMGWTANGGINTLYRQLLLNLMINHSGTLLIRIGGGSSDNTGDPSIARVSPTAALIELYQFMQSHLVHLQYTLGLNMGNDVVSLAQTQMAYYANQLPPASVAAYEVGNEPDNYGYNGIAGRPRSYSYGVSTAYLQDFANFRAALIPTFPAATTLMGPSWGIQRNTTSLGTFASAEAQYVGIASQHIYGGYHDGTAFTDDYLLQPIAVASSASLAVGASIAHQFAQKYRVGEMNSIDGGGVDGISNTFQSALWATDILFEFANAKVDGVNWHWASGATYSPALFNQTRAGMNYVYTLNAVGPEYYGMLLFQKATQNQAKLLSVTVSSSSNVKVWATLDQSGVIRVVIINKEKYTAGNVNIALPGFGRASLLRLQAQNYQSKTGITMGGQTLEGSSDGKLVGTLLLQAVNPFNGSYTVMMPAAQAAMLEVSGVNDQLNAQINRQFLSHK